MALIRGRHIDGFGLAPHWTRCIAASLAWVIGTCALAQEAPSNSTATPQAEPPAAETPAPPSSGSGFFDALGRFFGSSQAAIDSGIKDTLGKAAGAAKDAVGTVGGIPATQFVRGREVCPVAANGAPDCQQAVDALCRSKGFQTGRSVDVGSGRRCRAKLTFVNGKPKVGECRIETYVSRAVCH